jgi:hypothetical protein
MVSYRYRSRALLTAAENIYKHLILLYFLSLALALQTTAHLPATQEADIFTPEELT